MPNAPIPPRRTAVLLAVPTTLAALLIAISTMGFVPSRAAEVAIPPAPARVLSVSARVLIQPDPAAEPTATPTPTPAPVEAAPVAAPEPPAPAPVAAPTAARKTTSKATAAKTATAARTTQAKKTVAAQPVAAKTTAAPAPKPAPAKAAQPAGSGADYSLSVSGYCGEVSCVQKSVDSSSLAYIHIPGTGLTLIAGHRNGAAGVIGKFQVGDTIRVTGNGAGLYRITGLRTVARGTSSNQVPAGLAFQTCVGSQLRLAYATKI